VALEAGRPYMSIGEVLNVLKDEFPDVTVSKIRFLESEGLIQPERTVSGYRKFSHVDVDRLRFVLRLQRDHFLPLKVIRERLEEWSLSGKAGGGAPAPMPSVESVSSAPDSVPVLADPDVLPTFGGTGLSMSPEEFERASGLSAGQISELRGFGLLSPKDTPEGSCRYTEVDLEVAKLSHGLIKLGLEPRHLRMFRSTVDRWKTLADQMVLPLYKQRNPDARRQAAETVRELSRIGSRLMLTLLREDLSAYL
jgi:DNA-binding transcriptional MerR regulator